MFAAGDAAYSGTALLRDAHTDKSLIWRQPTEYINRHSCHRENLLPIINQFKDLHVMVVGDLILDEYIQCEALGMSREDPTLVVSPQESRMFIGGAGIVAAHCKGMGAKVSFYSIIGKDDLSEWAKKKLTDYGIQSHLHLDSSRPTTLKQRYRVAQKTIMRVSHLRQHEIGSEIQERIVKDIAEKLPSIDLLIFSDFNYGVLPQSLVEQIIELGRKRKIIMAADSQTSSQMGDISRFSGVDLVTPTEHEARISLRDHISGLHIIAGDLLEKINSSMAVITLGEAGSLVMTKEGGIDRLPSMNTSPIDVSGAGDSMLVGIAMAKTLGASPFQSAYIGAIASAIQVGRVGNSPIQFSEIKQALI
jgi:rfaE bifunctional protein kinase chain/domain